MTDQTKHVRQEEDRDSDSRRDPNEAGTSKREPKLLHKTRRWILMLDLLHSRAAGMTVQEIRAALVANDYDDAQCSIRNIQRDLNEMGATGYAMVTHDDGIPRRWRLEKKALGLFSSRLTLTTEMAMTLKLAIDQMQTMLPPRAHGELMASRDVAEKLLEKAFLNGTRPWIASMRVLESAIPSQRLQAEPEIRQVIYDALSKRKQVLLSVRRAPAEVYHPLGLVIGAISSKVIAHQDGKIVVVELHHIKRGELTDRARLDLADFDLDKFIESYFPRERTSSTSGPPTVSGKTRFVAEIGEELLHYFEFKPLAEQTLTPIGDRWRIEAACDTTVHSRSFFQFLLAHGPDVVVSSPSSLRKDLCDYSRAILAAHSDSDEPA